MKHSGTIALEFQGDFLDHKQYKCKAMRNDIIAYWKRLYGKRINDCSIVIKPNTDTDAIKPNGMNLKYPQGIKRKAFDPYLKMRA